MIEKISDLSLGMRIRSLKNPGLEGTVVHLDERMARIYWDAWFTEDFGSEDRLMDLIVRAFEEPGLGKETELVRFRLFSMPCCGHQLCWVNPRIPSFCPECGSPVYMKLKFGAGESVLKEADAWLTMKEER